MVVFMVLSCQIISRNQFILENGSHPKDSIIIVIEGSFSCETNNNEYKVSKNDIFFFKSGDIFKRKILSPLKAIYIIFDNLTFDFNQKIILTNYNRYIENIYFLTKAISEDNLLSINHFINDIFYCCTSNIKKTDSTIKEIKQYLQENYNHNISLDTLASTFNISKQWLILRFKKELGTTPMAYLNNFRMKKAKQLLLNQQINVGEVAYACGFETPYYFTNTFKKHFDISPTEWRKTMIL